MALKAVVDSLDDVGEAFRGEYVERNGKFYLDVEGGEADELRRGRDREKAAARDARKRANDLQAELDEAREKLAEFEELSPEERERRRKARKDDDSAWKRRAEEADRKRAEELAAERERTQKRLVSAEAKRLAAELSTTPSLLAPVLERQLRVDFDDDDYPLIVVGSDGQPTGKDIAALKKSILDNPEFKTILKASNGSGGGASGQGSGTGLGGGAVTLEAFRKMGGVQRSELFRTDAETFRRLAAEEKAATERPAKLGA